VKVEYISHACLLIDTGEVRIATDPWFAGPAYSQQWYVFPKRRVLRYLVRQLPLRSWQSWRKSATRGAATNYDRGIWLLRDAEELRKMFGLPEVNVET
jgi:hypothetical protein